MTKAAFRLAISAALCGTFAAASAQTSTPIQAHFDMHVDPWNNGLPLSQEVSTFQTQVWNMNWVMDQTEPCRRIRRMRSTGPHRR